MRLRKIGVVATIAAVVSLNTMVVCAEARCATKTNFGISGTTAAVYANYTNNTAEGYALLKGKAQGLNVTMSTWDTTFWASYHDRGDWIEDYNTGIQSKRVGKNAGRVFTKMTEVNGDVCIIGVQRN